MTITNFTFIHGKIVFMHNYGYTSLPLPTCRYCVPYSYTACVDVLVVTNLLSFLFVIKDVYYLLISENAEKAQASL